MLNDTESELGSSYARRRRVVHFNRGLQRRPGKAGWPGGQRGRWWGRGYTRMGKRIWGRSSSSRRRSRSRSRRKRRGGSCRAAAP